MAIGTGVLEYVSFVASRGYKLLPSSAHTRAHGTQVGAQPNTRATSAFWSLECQGLGQVRVFE